ncbi:MAG: M14 family metallopeptidase [Verrucomicrobiota bacterium]
MNAMVLKRSTLAVCSLALALAAALLVGAPRAWGEVKVALQEHRTWEFKSAGVRFNNQFAGARLNECEQVGDRTFRIVIRPEKAPINNSAWYAFQVVSRKPQFITVRLAYENGAHRYHPKASSDGKVWLPLAESQYHVDAATKEAVLTLGVGPKPLWVAGQEMFVNADFAKWMSKVDKARFVKKKTIGRSMRGEPIQQLEISESAPPNYVFIVGRQHPPEVTGTMGLMAFVETICGDSELAKSFRKQFRTAVVPLMNPDGVREGHWRLNLGGVDLNRDWKNFAHPETQVVRAEILRLAEQPGAKPFLLLDFHSTHHDVFYTQPKDAKMFPADFTEHWLESIKTRFPDYKLARSGDHNPNMGTSKGWGYEQFHIPAITYEFGDNTDRELIRKISTGAAEEMMRTLLAAVNAPAPSAR